MCCSVLLVVIGCGLSIAGIIVFSVENPRYERVMSYNKLGTTYTDEDFTPFGTLSFSLQADGNVTNATQSVTSVDYVGSSENVKDFRSRAFVIHGISRDALSSAVLTYQSTATAAPVRLNPLILTAAPRSVMRTVQLNCDTKDCSGSKGNCVCSSSVMQSKCSNLYQGVYEAASRGGNRECRDDHDDPCGSCRYTAFLTGVCIPVAFNPSSMSTTVSVKYASCQFPFTTNDGSYDSAFASSLVTVTIKTDSDPSIQLQRITSGSRWFGWSSRDQTGVALGLLIPGLIIICIGAMCIACVRRSHARDMKALAESNDLEMNNHPTGGATGGVIQVGQPIQQQQPPMVPGAYETAVAQPAPINPYQPQPAGQQGAAAPAYSYPAQFGAQPPAYQGQPMYYYGGLPPPAHAGAQDQYYSQQQQQQQAGPASPGAVPTKSAA